MTSLRRRTSRVRIRILLRGSDSDSSGVELLLSEFELELLRSGLPWGEEGPAGAGPELSESSEELSESSELLESEPVLCSGPELPELEPWLLTV